MSANSPPPVWRSLAEQQDDPAFLARIGEEFPGLTPLLAEPRGRRQVLALMGASLALSLGGCDPGDPKGHIIPAVVSPPGIVPGVENSYATATVLDGYATGVRVRHQSGRPMRVDGNPLHPSSLGAAGAISQAAILSLYDPDRSHGVTLHDQPAGWTQFITALEQRRATIAARRGTGLRILTGTVTSPTLAAQLAAAQALYPEMRWHQWQPVSRDAIRGGAMLAYGRPVDTVYQPAQADVILAIESDLLSAAPGHLRYAREFAGRRNPVSGPMSRLYAVESTPDLTGIMADHRFVAGPGDLHRIVEALAAMILRGEPPGSGAPPWLAIVARDLQDHPGRALIHIGPDQPAAHHALVHAMNEALGGRDKVFHPIEPVEAAPIDQAASFTALIADMTAGRVQDLLILGENPVFTAPDFKAALKHVPFSISLGQEPDETAAATLWHVPETHAFETWSDARGHDGSVTVLQPQTMPLFGGHSAHELLALLTGNSAPDPYAIVSATWMGRAGQAGWHTALANGLVANSASPVVTVPIRDLRQLTSPPPEEQPITLLLRPDPQIWDGRFANSAWLQELPRPLTKMTWDNPLLVAPALAARMKVGNGDMVRIAAGERSMVVPVWIQPGQAADCVVAYRGFGRWRVGAAGQNAGFDFVPLTLSGNRIAIEKAAGSYNLATTEHHNPLDAAPEGVVRHATLANFTADPALLRSHPSPASLYSAQPPAEMAWGMSIDLNSCIGCNACVIACQAENNIPVVGKEQVLREREMQWLRIDRYYEGSPEAPNVLLQPMLCMHCEDAPCEVVCPVGATLHDAEGLNVMVYNRCVGTRFCSNNCPYKVRRFNYFAYAEEEVRPDQARNQEVTVRARGVMEKCSFCVQRIAAARIDADKEDRPIRDGEVVTACQAACPTRAFNFGNIHDAASGVAHRKASPLSYALLDELNTKPRVTYEGRIRNPNPAIKA